MTIKQFLANEESLSHEELTIWHNTVEAIKFIMVASILSFPFTKHILIENDAIVAFLTR